MTSPLLITFLTSFLNSYKYYLFSDINNNELATKAPVVSVPAEKRVINYETISSVSILSVLYTFYSINNFKYTSKKSPPSYLQPYNLILSLLLKITYLMSCFNLSTLFMSSFSFFVQYCQDLTPKSFYLKYIKKLLTLNLTSDAIIDPNSI